MLLPLALLSDVTFTRHLVCSATCLVVCRWSPLYRLLLVLRLDRRAACMLARLSAVRLAGLWVMLWVPPSELLLELLLERRSAKKLAHLLAVPLAWQWETLREMTKATPSEMQWERR